tara:strand:+ start:2646 stop:2822 length:177 start_codon:yes stop_codon:yes gene_type:complete
LKTCGYLFLGASENVTQFADLFKSIDRKHRIFQKTDEVITSAPFSASMAELASNQSTD